MNRGYTKIEHTELGTKYGSSPYLFDGLMIGRLILSLILAIFAPDIRKVTQSDQRAENSQQTVTTNRICSRKPL